MKVAITGHRPEKIADSTYVTSLLRQQFLTLNPSEVIVGMAAGIDLWAGETALELGIPVVAARPWTTHAPRQGDIKAYDLILTQASRVVVVDEAERYPGAWVYHKRNQWMVNESDLLLAVWDGEETGGTYQCTKYALGKGKHLLAFDPITGKQKEYNPPAPPSVDLFSM